MSREKEVNKNCPRGSPDLGFTRQGNCTRYYKYIKNQRKPFLKIKERLKSGSSGRALA
jgi:hypothetical protein